MNDHILIPIRCYTCSRVIAIKSIIDEVEKAIVSKEGIKEILKRENFAYCCRIHFTTKYITNEE
jgi:DNA-directed RNA polymerase subunit N (RpoN/RPB10)